VAHIQLTEEERLVLKYVIEYRSIAYIARKLNCTEDHARYLKTMVVTIKVGGTRPKKVFQRALEAGLVIVRVKRLRFTD